MLSNDTIHTEKFSRAGREYTVIQNYPAESVWVFCKRKKQIIGDTCGVWTVKKWNNPLKVALRQESSLGTP